MTTSRATRQRRTPKQRVLRRAPDALACYTGCIVCKWEIRAWGRNDYSGQLGLGKNQRAAWADAARRI